MTYGEQRWLTLRLLKAATLRNQTPAKSDSPLWLGIDLGACNVASMVMDSDGQPVVACLDRADVARDGIVWDSSSVVTIVRRHLNAFEQQLGCRFTHVITSFPSGTDPWIPINVLESAELEVSHGLDEPTAVVDLLWFDSTDVVDISGGTIGVAIARQGKVTYLVDEVTGGHHISLTLVGNRRTQLEKAEQYKYSDGRGIWPVMKLICEKMVKIMAYHTAERGAADLWLVDDPCMQPGVDELLRKRFPELQVHLPQYSLFMASLTTVNSGKEKVEGIYAS